MQLLALVAAAACVATPSTTSAPSASPAASVEASASSSAAVPSGGAQPPAALLGINAPGSNEGVLGTYVYRGGGSDAPWLPARALRAIAAVNGIRLIVRLADQGSIGAWSARIAPASDDQGATTRPLAIQPDANARSAFIELPVPAPGSWVLGVTLSYGDGSGTGTYFWLITVT